MPPGSRPTQASEGVNNVVSKARARRARAKERGDRVWSPGRGRRLLGAAALALLLWGVALALVVTSRGLPRYVAGTVARNTVICRVPFQVPDITATRLRQVQASEAVPPVFRVKLPPADQVQQRLRELRNQAGRSADTRARRELRNLLSQNGIDLPVSRFLQIVPADRPEQFLSAFAEVLEGIAAAGVISPDDRESGFAGLASSGNIIIAGPAGTVTTRVAEVRTPREAAEAAARELRSRIQVSASAADLARLFRAWLKPNLVYDAARTEELRAAARSAVSPVMTTIQPGQPIVRAGELITPEVLNRLTTHERLLQERTPASVRLQRHLGQAALLLLWLITAWGVLLIACPETARSARQLVFLSAVATLNLLVVAGLLMLLSRTFLERTTALATVALPVGIAPLMAAIFIRGPAVLPVGIWTSAASGLIAGRPFDTLLCGLLVTVVAATSAREIHRRSRLLAVGFWIGCAAAVSGLALGLAAGIPKRALLLPLSLALASGVLSAAVVLILIPVFEAAFRMTTDIALLELSDLSHPLLKRLAVEAPGTYHHSLMVANLAEAAAREIGANPLLVRVAAYYHDIGKLTKPEFFAENLQMRPNPHDDLSPSMSALVIASHIKEGVSLARRHRLPPAIVDAIQQHHGTSMISFFYQRAKQQEQNRDTGTRSRPVEEKDFRYPGPLPRSREMALIALADAVEAASRTLEKPTAARIENLVDEIFKRKLLDGQLDESQLTLRELAAIRRVFIFTLTNMLHERIQYPEDETHREKPAEPASTRPGQTAETRPGTRA